MEVEVIKFFVIDINENNNTLTGSMTVRLPDLGGLCILGILVSRRKDSWFFNIPSRNGIHHESGISIRYPLIAFEDREKQKDLIEAINREGRSFIEKRLADKETPLIFLQQPQPKSNKPEHVKERESETGAKQTASVAKPKPAMQEWIDPPKRKLQKR